MNHQIMKDKRILRKVNAGFTLVEMIVVLTIMAIMMGAAVWGVTGWIAHYEYVSSEEKAKTIYMAAQSALSAAESRGTLDEYMKSFEGGSDGIVKFAKNTGDPGLDKATYGIPLNTDNEGEIHDYGYLVVNKGDYIAHPEKPLFKMLETYVSDSEQLNASIVVEFDLTAKKVYSAFYSNWSTSIQYDDSASCVERGDFFITADRRTPEFRENYQVGYYSADQVNVVKLDNLPQLKMVECELHNEETLFLTLKSSSENAEANTVFNITLLEDTDAKPVLCNFSISRNMLISMYGTNDKNKPVLIDNIPAYDAEGKKIDDFQFVVSFNEHENAEDGFYLSVILDALSTEQSMAVLDEADTVTGRTDNAGYSITRLIGTEPKNILASVTVEPLDPTTYSSSRPMESNTENSLYATKEETGEFASYYDVASAYLISRNRHLSNIRYNEDYAKSEDEEHKYVLTKDLDFNDAVIYDGLDRKVNADFSYYSIPKDDADFVFPMISKLNAKSVFDGNGNQLANFKLSNKSSVAYEHGDDGKVITANAGELPVNKATALGLFGNNKGMIKRIIVSKADAKVMSKEDYDKSDGATGDEATRKAIYSDSLQAVGVICGRNEGDLREIYFDKDCKVEAAVFANLDDTKEAKENNIDISNPENRKNLNQLYGSGVGMAAGTVALKKNASIDRILTSGSVKGKITGKDTDFKEAPDVSADDERKEIYNETPDTSAGENVSNAQYYSYGVGGVFGYVYGKYDKDSARFGIGVDKDTITSYNALSSNEENGYVVMKKRNGEVTTKVLSPDGGKKNVTSYEKSDTSLFATDETRSIVNKANVVGDDVSFIGGIVGNLYIAGLKDNKVTENDDDGYVRISDSAHPHMLNCFNYGDTSGNDFVGGVLGVNGEGGYIKACESYGSPSATKGVSAGIASENFGFMKDCLVDRAVADEAHDNKPYVPQIKGNMVFAGAITSVNHKECIVSDCECSVKELDGVDDKIIISGNDVDTFGYLVGRNDGVVDNGRTGKHLGYKSNKTKLIIGGAVGTNSEDAVVKNVEVTFDFKDEGQAECVGGVVGHNKGDVNNCKFGGSITKNKKSSAGMTIGGIVAKNGMVDASVNATTKNSYVIGAVFDIKGSANFSDGASEKQILSSSSAIGGVCGINYQYSNVDNCYVTSLKKEDGTKKQSKIDTDKGMVGGITAVNMGEINGCGYTDNEFSFNDSGRLAVAGSKKADMGLAKDAVKYLKDVSSEEKTTSRSAVKNLNKLFKDDMTEAFTDRVTEILGTIPADEANYVYAFPKYESDGKTLKYDVSANDYIISLNKGTGYVGGIAGYNTTSGKVRNCASGKWVVENYLPTKKYNAVGGVIGLNGANDTIADSNGKIGSSVAYNINFAYVRTELPNIPESAVDNNSQVNGNVYNHTFYYVGGVIGTQNNTSSVDWTVEKCINAGTVLNYFGNNTGGVIAQLKGNGGTVQYSYNYGMLMDGFTGTSGFSGTSGGIVAHYTDLKPDQVNNVLHCQNHGVISFPMKGLDYDTCTIKNKFGKMTSNDVGGVVGEISAPQSVDLYTVNIKDCVNGVDARVYASSKAAGILGTIGCFAKEGVQIKNTVNSIFVNIDTCRSYTSQLYSAQNNSVGAEFTLNAGAINSGRDPYDTNSPITGYTTVRNCFGVRMYGYNSDGNVKVGSNVQGRGAISYFKSGQLSENKATYRYCGNNYYLDELSFQYCKYNGSLLEEIIDFILNIFFKNGTKDANKINAIISKNNFKYAVLYHSVGDSNINYINPVSKYYNQEPVIASERIISAQYDDSHYVLFKEPQGYNPRDYNAYNTYTDGNKVYVRRNTYSNSYAEVPVIYKFSEKGSQDPYSNKLVDHFYFDRLKKSKKYRDGQASNYSGVNLLTKVSKSRIPTSDEYDMNYADLDDCFIDFIENNKNNNPDRITNVNVAKSSTMGNYEVKWDVEPAAGNQVASATEFDVRIRYIAVDKGTFSFVNVNEYLDEAKDYLLKDYNTDPKKAYGTTTTFVQPEKMMTDSSKDYYAVVDVRDSKSTSDNDYSQITDTDTARSYIKLVPKLATPDVEIVAYGEKWMLHLKNPDDYIGNTTSPDFKIHAYTMNGKNEDKKADILASDITFTTDPSYNTQILSNAVSAEQFKKANAGQEIYFIAKADDCISSEKAMITAYVPLDCHPSDMKFNLKADDDGDHLNDGNNKPYYTGTLTYEQYDSSVHPTVPQVFKVELYGVKKDAEGNVLYHKTLAEKEVYLSEGEMEDVKIGYFDAASGVKFDYDEYKIDYWYSSTGQGAYNYFETPAQLAADKVRSTGFITDVSKGTAENKVKYYFHSVQLPMPEVEIVCINRDPSWYARLLNQQDYEGTDAEIIMSEDTSCKISTTDKVNDLLGYATKLDATKGEMKRSFVARKEGFYDSPAFSYSPTNQKVNVQKNLINELKVGYKLEGTLGIEERDTNSGKVKDLKFNGILSYNCANYIHEYYRSEVYAYNDKNEAVTLYLSDDIKMEKGDAGQNSYKTITNLDIEIKGDDENSHINLDDYHDFHVAVWYSNGDLSKDESVPGFAQYIELTKEQTKLASLGYYDESKQSYAGARDKGLLIDVSGGEGNYKYYYVAALADKRYGEISNTYKGRELYRENAETISSIQKDGDGKDIISAEGDVVTWKMRPTYYGDADGGDVMCDVDVRIYQVKKETVEGELGGEGEGNDESESGGEDEQNEESEEMVKLPEREELESGEVFDTYTKRAVNHTDIISTSNKSYDFENYYYYALVRVKDVDAAYDDAYSKAVVVKLEH